MRLGQKAATTRLLDGPDDLTGVSHPGDLCIGEVGTRGFGILVIRRVLDMYFSDVDDALAKIENMKVSALQAFTRNFSCVHARNGRSPESNSSTILLRALCMIETLAMWPPRLKFTFSTTSSVRLVMNSKRCSDFSTPTCATATSFA